MVESVPSRVSMEQDPWLGIYPPRRWHLLLAAAALTGVYLAGVTAVWWPTPDSALYQSLARSLLTGQGYRHNGQLSTTVTPGLPLLLAGLKAVFGSEANWAANLAMALCGLALLLASYLAVARMAGRRMALYVTLTVGLSYKTFELSHLILTDIPFAAAFWWLLYVCLRYVAGGRRLWLVAAGAMVAVGFTVRAPGLLPLVALAPAMLLDRGSSAPPRRRWAVAGVLLGTAAVTALAYYRAATHLEAKLPAYAAHASEGLTSVGGLLGRVKTTLLLPTNAPGVLAEMMSSQKSTPVGVVLLILGLVGLVSLWVRGRRLTPAVTILYLVGLVLAAGGEALRERFLVTIYPMIVLSILEGLCLGLRAAGAVARWNRRVCLVVAMAAGVAVLGAAVWALTAALLARPQPWLISACAVAAGVALLARMGLVALGQPPTKGYLQAASFVVALLVAVNLPRLGRNAFYYGYLGRANASGYYATVRHGQFAEVFQVADLLRAAAPRDARIAASDEQTSILHYLSGRLVAPIPEAPCDTAARADFVYGKYVASGAELYVTSLPEGQTPFRERLEEHFAATAGLAPIHKGKQFVVYQYLAPAGRGASRPASRP